MGVAEIGAVAAVALGLRTGACRCRGLAAQCRPRVIAAGGQSGQQGDDASELQGAESSSHGVIREANPKNDWISGDCQRLSGRLAKNFLDSDQADC